MLDIILITGYAGMGKDHFAEMLSRREEWNGTYSFWVRCIRHQIMMLYRPYKTIKFASKLKDEVSNILGMSVEELDAKKDTPLDRQYEWKRESPVDDPTYRHVLIDYAEHVRATEPDHYVSQAASDCGEDMLNVVTDWRNYNELDIANYINCECRMLTARVHRDGVDIPPKDLVSEHYLTETEVDVLILPHDKTPMDYVDLFPWASGYKIEIKFHQF